MRFRRHRPERDVEDLRKGSRDRVLAWDQELGGDGWDDAHDWGDDRPPPAPRPRVTEPEEHGGADR